MPCNVNPELIKLCSTRWVEGTGIEASDVATRRRFYVIPYAYHRDRIRAALGLSGTHYPADYSISASVDGFAFTVRNGVSTGPVQGPLTRYQAELGVSLARPRHAPFRHRVCVLCPTCERWIPIGRIAQHAGKFLGKRERRADGRFAPRKH